MKKEPLVSVIIPCYNSEDWIGETLDSVYSQTYRNLEVITVDDGSTDNTRKVIKNYDGSIKYFHQENKGPSAARNLGLKKARGKYIAFLDSDDLWETGKIKKQIEILEKNKNIHLSLTDINVIDENNEYIYTHHNKVPDRKEIIISSFFKGEITMNTPTIVARRNSVLSIGGFDEDLPMREDHFFLMNMVDSFEIHHLSEALIKRRVRNDSISHSVQPQKIFELHKPFIKKSLEQFPYLMNYKEYVLSSLYIALGTIYWKNNDFHKSIKNIKNGIKKNPFKFKNYIIFIIIVLRIKYQTFNKIKNFIKNKLT